MDLIVKIKENYLENDIVNLLAYLKSNKCVKKFDVRVENLRKIKKISDKETVNSLHLTSSKALSTFLENEKESIF
jgi:hypothetical protein